MEKKAKPVTLYCENGTSLAYRYSGRCRKCSITDFTTFYSFDGNRFLKIDDETKFLLSTEDTAFETSLLETYEWEITIGCMPFRSKVAIYNCKHGYMTEPSETNNKEKKTTINNERLYLDRRRFTDGFLLYLVAKISRKYKIEVNSDVTDRNNLVDSINESFYDAFLQKWSTHSCGMPGCSKVLILDGNMKACRQVCSVKEVTRMGFKTIPGQLITGCMNTPSKGLRVCEEHKETTALVHDDSIEEEMEVDRTEVEMNLSQGTVDENVDTNENDDKNENDDTDENDDKNEKSDSDGFQGVIKILDKKETRNSKLYKILWHTGKTTWVRDEKLSKNLLSANNKVVIQEENSLGQPRQIIKFQKNLTNTQEELNACETGFAGFAVEAETSEYITEDGETRKLKCSTEKSKHKSKNRKTAELICYDDACHLRRYSENPIRKDLTLTSKRISSMEFYIDRFHYKNHKDPWCRRNCNPDKSSLLKNVNTEACEQLFSWFSRYSRMTKHMNRQRFLFLTLYLMDFHNENIKNIHWRKKT
ncbi:uncharacterized protein [Clytia hemisphaerica]|uniref:uncharacterized protein n=1 Tax=Clytia hemisphaerica TaxID=252671 RepID=UPI0034D49547